LHVPFSDGLSWYSLYTQGSRLKFNIRRDHLLEDAYEHVMKSDVRHLQRKRLNITFRGEEG